MNSKGKTAEKSLLSGKPITIAFSGVILLALIVLALLRHFFGAIRVEAGTK